MKELQERVRRFGLSVLRRMIDEVGWAEGQEVSIVVEGDSIRMVPRMEAEDALLARALRYLARHVGDATSVGTPRSVGDGWELPVDLAYRDRQPGVLLFDTAGELLPGSTPPVQMRAAADAP